MPPIQFNRRRFLSYSAAASLALSQGNLAEAAALDGESHPVRLGVIGIGNRGTALLRSVLELPGTEILAVCDSERKHRQRGEGIVEKARGKRPESCDDPRRIFDRADLDAVLVALPCDAHDDVHADAIAAGKHLYAEKPLSITLDGCDRLIAAGALVPNLVVHVGFQRRSNPRFRQGIELIGRGDLGPLIEARASWTSSNGPINGHNGWLARRARSGDWMVEQGVHIWDVFHWLKGSPPVRATGWGRRDLFASVDQERDVTDHYSVDLEWADGFRASFVQSWITPVGEGFTGSSLRVLGEQGGFDFNSGALTFRDRNEPARTIAPGPQPDTRLALEAFLKSVRSSSTAPVPAPLSLADARAATRVGLLVRKAVEDRRTVEMSEIPT
jgi:myo-inositol 2-dehydrogenase / D-chiro-inositol 1-dehydrogenase